LIGDNTLLLPVKDLLRRIISTPYLVEASDAAAALDIVNEAVTLPGHMEMLRALESEAVNSLKEILPVVTFCMILVLRARNPKHHPAKILLLAAAVSIKTGSNPILT